MNDTLPLTKKIPLNEVELEYLRKQTALFYIIWCLTPLPDKRWRNVSYRPFKEWGTPYKNEKIKK